MVELKSSLQSLKVVLELWDKRNYKKEQDINREINKSLKGKIF